MDRLSIILMMVIIGTTMNTCIMEPEPCDPMIDYIIKNTSSYDVELIVFYKDFDNNSDTAQKKKKLYKAILMLT
jgi:hypothetical protein